MDTEAEDVDKIFCEDGVHGMGRRDRELSPQDRRNKRRTDYEEHDHLTYVPRRQHATSGYMSYD
eukprot:698224-Karenia_brevis.AAC.1